MKAKLIIASLSILVVFSCVKKEFPRNEENLSMEEKILGYDYPVKPGTEQWKKLANSAEKIKACQIPPSILTKLTTEELVNTCLRYPLLQNIYAFNNIQRGVDKLIDDFNGMRELLKRKDGYKAVLDVYSIKVDNSSLLQEKTATIQKGNYILSLSTLEMILGTVEMRTNPEIDIQKNAMKELLKAYELKINNSNEFKGVGFLTNLLSRASIVLEKNDPLFLSTKPKINIDADLINKIDLRSRNLVNE